MRVRILHSTERGFRFEPWVPEAPMARVDEYDPLPGHSADDLDSTGIPTALLDVVYRDHQAVTGGERCVTAGVRSLSVGDVVQLDCRAFACEPLGWREIDPTQLTIREEA
jgi:hypothetical protein